MGSYISDTALDIYMRILDGYYEQFLPPKSTCKRSWLTKLWRKLFPITPVYIPDYERPIGKKDGRVIIRNTPKIYIKSYLNQ